MNTLMIVSMDQGKGFTEDALRPVPLFDLAERIGAALAAFARRVATIAALRPAQA
jgi:hypothetical protein